MNVEHRSRASEALGKWMRANGKTQMWLAAEIGVAQASVSAWLRGKAPPKVSAALAIAKISKGKVAVRMWGQPPRSATRTGTEG